MIEKKRRRRGLHFMVTGALAMTPMMGVGCGGAEAPVTNVTPEEEPDTNVAAHMEGEAHTNVAAEADEPPHTNVAPEPEEPPHTNVAPEPEERPHTNVRDPGPEPDTDG